jgi:hypothetical protein
MNGYNQVCLSGVILGEIRRYTDSSQNPKLVFMLKNDCTSFYVEAILKEGLSLESGNRILVMGSLFSRKLNGRYLTGIRAETIVLWPETLPQVPETRLSIPI